MSSLLLSLSGYLAALYSVLACLSSALAATTGLVGALAGLLGTLDGLVVLLGISLDAGMAGSDAGYGSWGAAGGVSNDFGGWSGERTGSRDGVERSAASCCCEQGDESDESTLLHFE